MSDVNGLSGGQPAPDFVLRDLEGRPHTLSHYRGRVVVLNFWSAECPWSRRADEAIHAFMETWGDRVVWISIAPNASETLDEIRAEARARHLPLLLHDSEREVTERYGAEATPHLYVLDEKGTLRYRGAFDDVTFRQKTPTRNYLKEAVDALLAGEEPVISAAPAYGCTIVYYAEY